MLFGWENWLYDDKMAEVTGQEYSMTKKSACNSYYRNGLQKLRSLFWAT